MNFTLKRPKSKFEYFRMDLPKHLGALISKTTWRFSLGTIDASLAAISGRNGPRTTRQRSSGSMVFSPTDRFRTVGKLWVALSKSWLCAYPRWMTQSLRGRSGENVSFRPNLTFLTVRP